MHLSGGHGLGNQPLDGQLLLLEVLSRGIGKLKGSHGLADAALDLLLLATLKLEGQSRVGDDLLDTADVRLKLLLGLELLAESLVVALESLGVYFELVWTDLCTRNRGNIPLIIFSISPVESLPTELAMVMLAERPEVFSVAVTLRIPLTSTSKTTSRTASPALMGGIGARVNSPREVLSSQLTRSPWKTGNCYITR